MWAKVTDTLKSNETKNKLSSDRLSLTLSCFTCALNLYFAQKSAQKGKFARLLKVAKTAKVDPYAKICSKITKHKRDRPKLNTDH